MNGTFSSLRLPPQNAQAEQALLGALLANNKAFDRVSEFLQPHHFADPVHSFIFAAISRRVNAGQVADPVTLRGELENSNVMEPLGGVAYLAQLLGSMVGIINAADYGRAVHDAWLRRELIDACEVAVNMAFTPTGVTGQEVMEELDGALTRISDGAGEVRPAVSAGDAVTQALALSHAAGERDGALAGITTGYAAIDRVTGGLMPGTMTVLGARPAMGKTGLGLGVAARAASTGLKVLFWSGEMSGAQMGTRLAAAHAGLEVLSVFRGKGLDTSKLDADGHGRVYTKLSPDAWDNLVRAQTDAQALPLTFDDRQGVTVAGLRSRARRMKRGKGLDLIVVDYVGLMRASPQAEKQKQYERLTEISRDLQMLAVEMHVPLLVLAQLNRANESRENKMPQLSDLRDTGALEQDAYCVMFLHRPHYYLMQAGPPLRGKEKNDDFQDRAQAWAEQEALTRNQAIVMVAKNRNGPTGPCKLRFDAPSIWFRDESEADRSPAWGRDFLGGY
jgi:replicative DNA helicase